MGTTRQKVAALMPLVERLHRGHCWLKTPEGPRRIGESLDDFKIAEHVAGRKAYGACPIAPGANTTRVALLDLDSHKGETPWGEMLDTAQTVAFALEQEGHTPILFKSSGGNGIHLYLLWDEPQDAYSVRTMLNDTLTVLGYKSGTGGVAAKQIEVFPKQDEVPADGYGSMFVLPHAGKSEPIGAFPGWLSSPAVPHRERPPKPERGATDSPELAVLRSALDAIPNDTDPLDYDAWRNVLFAIHHATGGSDEGLALAHEFSSRSGKYDADFIDNRFWPYAGVTSGEVITERSLFALASTHGWQDPTIADDFDVVPGTETAADDFDVVPETADEKPLRFMPVPAHEFAVATQLRWIIKGVLPHAELAVLYGESGSGKSFMALDMAAAIARGIEWRGHRVHKGKVVYIAAEGANGFRNRLRAYAHQQAIDLKDLDIHVVHAAPNMLDKADALDVAKAIVKVVGRPDLIIIDTLAQTMPGGNENAGEDMGKALAHCRGLHRATGALVMLVHHSGKDASKGARGWSGLRAAADVEMEVMRADDDRVLTITKQKDGDDGGEFGFKLETVLVDFDADGDEVTSCVVTHCEAASGVKDRRRAKPLGDIEKAVLQALEDTIGPGSEVVPEARLALAAKEMLDPPEAGKRDTRLQRVGRAIESLIAVGRMHREEEGLAIGGAR